MTSGGARARPGFAPDPQALRRDRPSDAASWTHLPAKREGETPAWPLFRPTKRELELWAHEWTRPQAVMWEANGQENEVALYVRALVAAEQRKASPPARTLVKQLQEALGLSLPGLARNRWVIGEEDRPARRAVSPEARASARDRLKVVAGGA